MYNEFFASERCQLKREIQSTFASTNSRGYRCRGGLIDEKANRRDSMRRKTGTLQSSPVANTTDNKNCRVIHVTLKRKIKTGAGASGQLKEFRRVFPPEGRAVATARTVRIAINARALPRCGCGVGLSSARIQGSLPCGAHPKKAPHETGLQKMNISWRNLEDDVFQIDIEVPQQGVRNERVVPGGKVVVLCVGERRTRVEHIFNSK